MNPLELEREITKVTMAIMTRNRQIAADIITHLRTQMPIEEVAGLIFVSLERLLWFDANLVLWAIENLIPMDIRQEIKSIILFTTYQQLINKGLIPGKDFSIDANGKLLQKSCSST